MNMPSAHPDNKTRDKDHGASGINAINKITLQTGGQAPDDQKVAAQVVGITGIVAVVIGLALIFTGYPTWGVILVIAAFILMGIAVVVALKAASKPQQQALAPIAPTIAIPVRQITHRWSRIVPKQPVEPEDLLRGFITPLDDLRTTVIDVVNGYRKNKTKIEKSLVRSNIFLPRADLVEDYCEPVELFIPRFLQSNMGNFPDRNIVFRSHEGLTGRTFSLGQAYGAKAEPIAGGQLEWSAVKLFPDDDPAFEEWDHFELNRKQRSMIEPRIRWIVSLPILLQGTDPKQATVGVLNVDGLDHTLSNDEMNAIAKALADRVKQFAGELAKLPMCRISIEVESLLGVADSGGHHP
jgi:hypothetical protein